MTRLGSVEGRKNRLNFCPLLTRVFVSLSTLYSGGTTFRRAWDLEVGRARKDGEDLGGGGGSKSSDQI